MSKTQLLYLAAGLMLLTWLTTASASSRDPRLPMDHFNFQGYVPDSRHNRQLAEEDPSLVRLHVSPNLSWLVNQLIDAYQLNHQQTFRLHEGWGDDHSNLLDDGYIFDLVITDTLAYPQELLLKRAATEIRLLAVGRLALWAPQETVRSTNVIRLQTGAVGLMPEPSVYHQASLEVLASKELLSQVQARLQPATVFQDLYQLIATNEIPLGFIPWNRAVQEGIHKRPEVLLLDAKYHSAITHGIAITNAGAQRPEVQEFWEFIFSPKGRSLINANGFN